MLMKTIIFRTFLILYWCTYEYVYCHSYRNNDDLIGVPPIRLINPPKGIPFVILPQSPNADSDDYSLDFTESSSIASKNPITTKSVLQISCYVTCTDGNHNIKVPITCHIDTGAQATILSHTTAKKLSCMIQPCRSNLKAYGISGTPVSILGTIPSLTLIFSDGNSIQLRNVMVLEQMVSVPSNRCLRDHDDILLLGLDVLTSYSACIDLKIGGIVFNRDADNTMQELIIPFLNRNTITTRAAATATSSISKNLYYDDHKPNIWDYYGNSDENEDEDDESSEDCDYGTIDFSGI